MDDDIDWILGVLSGDAHTLYKEGRLGDEVMRQAKVSAKLRSLRCGISGTFLKPGSACATGETRPSDVSSSILPLFRRPPRDHRRSVCQQ